MIKTKPKKTLETLQVAESKRGFWSKFGKLENSQKLTHLLTVYFINRHANYEISDGKDESRRVCSSFESIDRQNGMENSARRL